MKVYEKNSFDRFGDDLTELILQYLTFEDKVRLECVSKQWKRCIYQKQFNIYFLLKRNPTKVSLKRLIKSNEFSEPSINRQSLESVFINCQNITKFSCHLTLDGEVLSLIGRYCHRIKSLKYNQTIDSHQKVLDFFVQYGHKLVELHHYRDNKEIPLYLAFCPNLKNVFLPKFLMISSEDKEFMPKLERIESIISVKPLIENNLFIDYMNKMNILSDKYSQNMKTLNIRIWDLNAEELKTCIEYICRFENLKELKLNIYIYEIEEPIDDCLSLIGQKCNKLLKLVLVIGNSVPISDRFFASFSEFQSHSAAEDILI